MPLHTQYHTPPAPHPRADLHHAILLRNRDLEAGRIVLAHAHAVHNRIIRQGIEAPILASRSRRHVLVPLVLHLQRDIGPARGLVAGDQRVVAGAQGALDVGAGAERVEADALCKLKYNTRYLFYACNSYQTNVDFIYLTPLSNADIEVANIK